MATLDETKMDVEHAENAHVPGQTHLSQNEMKHGDKALQLVGDETVLVTEADNQRIKRKTDIYILSILCWIYFLQILDKSILGYGNVFGLSADTHLKGNDYSQVASINAIAQLAWQPFSAWLIVKVPTRILLTTLVLGWGIAQCCMAACRNKGDLLATRFFLGLFEAGALPLFGVITSQWWRRAEQPVRVAAWYSTNGIATIFAALISFGLGHVNSPHIKSWALIFLICGIITVLSAPLVWFLLDNNVASARFLDHEDKRKAIERLRANQTGTGTNEFKKEQLWELLLDIKTYNWLFIALLLNIGASVTNAFGPTLLSNFGFNKFASPPYHIPFEHALWVPPVPGHHFGLLFNAKDKPHYIPGIKAVLAIFCVLLGVIAFQVVILFFLNKSKRRERVANGKPENIKDTSMNAKYETYGATEGGHLGINAKHPTQATALYNFRLLSALRSENPQDVQPFLDELQPSSRSAAGMEDLEKVGRLLAMAVRVGSVETIRRILASSHVPSPNISGGAGSLVTPLHVASSIGRADVVQLLLTDPRINDTIRDEQSRTPLECAATGEIASLIENSRGDLQIRYISLLSNYVSSPLSSLEESLAMVEFLEGPRTEIVNLNVLDEHTGTSLLHEAARRRDLRLVELSVKRGADVFVRDKKGKRVMDGEKAPDERIKVFLRQFNTQDNQVKAKGDGRPPDLRGFLSKWVNYRSGWRTRWFVLENGVLSYYRNRDDESVACRGSIAMGVAVLNPSNDGSRFEIHSRVSSSVPKFTVKSVHRAEIARWVQTIKLNIDYYGKGGKAADQRSIAPRRSTSVHSTHAERPLASSLAMPPIDNFLNPKLQRSTTGLSGISIKQSNSSRRDSSPAGTETADEGDDVSLMEADNSSLTGDNQATGSHGIPHASAYELGVLNIRAQLEMTGQLVDSIVTPPALQASPERGRPQLARTMSRQQAVKDAMRSSLSSLSNLIAQQNVMSHERERYLLSRIHREVEARRLWEENMLTVAQQQADMDRQLSEAAKDNEKKRKALRQARGVLAGFSAGGASMPSSPAAVSEAPQTGMLDCPIPVPPVIQQRGSVSHLQDVQDALAAADSDSEDEDEFFDAIESGALPNLKLYDSIANPERPATPQATAAAEKKTFDLVEQNQGENVATIKDALARKSLQPYSHVRAKLPIDDDKRPSVSLWSILKSSVGKDLTKISFPVSFNECTSMLQRMAEDMEYDACLTVASQEEDSLKRIAFIGAFAMSNYSSTIGRVAKPFNPMLSQSFEYAIPNRYRYISEQVSHHPPISACYSEAPSWKYYGEVDAQNKFQGRSFEIRPTGVAHAELIIPKSWVKGGLDYPAAGKAYGDGLVSEHYSWKKVTTNVSNFIMGSPIIDHYGDLKITNHRTGETCILTFKPRGWRGKDAFEIKGSVSDSAGKVQWEIAGRWDSQLVARKAGTSSAPLDSDIQVQPSQAEYLLLWRNSEKPKAPFNLTPFAVTLNDIPQGLEKYLCPTDCRLRVDQRAFEDAKYDRAQELKTLQEEKQRETRKARAEGRLPAHEARWFTSTVDADTQERLWEPKRAETGEVEFWVERERAAKEGQWSGVEEIFVEA
ncbi:oxysterol-binding protein 1, partial [Tremellales sp. Uapishka_1]